MELRTEPGAAAGFDGETGSKMVKATRYTAVCRRAGDWWAIAVPEINGVHTQARRLDQVEHMAREAIALMLDVAPDSFDVRTCVGRSSPNPRRRSILRSDRPIR